MEIVLNFVHSQKNFFMVIGGILLFFSAVLGFIYSRVTMHYLDEKLLEYEGELPVWDKGVGARMVHYAIALVSKRAGMSDVIVNGPVIVKNGRRIDVILSYLFLYMSLSAILYSVIFYIIYSE